ncbi:MAG TPA: hypothetical protein VMU39_11450 [Solirubrobacteraceae bacterium]|nr:hypothetical protein [Solirubrobacteraceae bacterium]
MKARVQRLAAIGSVQPEERELAGLVSGILYVLGGITLALFLVLPGVAPEHPGALLTIAGVCCLWGASSMFLIDWGRAPSWLIQLSSALALVAIAAAVASSGGAMSPAWIYLFFVAVFAAYFYRHSVAIGYLLACAAVHSLPLLYDGRSAHDSFIAQFAIAGAGILRLEHEGEAVVMGSWADHEGGRHEPGRVVTISSGGDVDQALRTNLPVRIDRHPPESPVVALGWLSSIVVPVHVAGRTWGVSDDPRRRA